MVLLGIRVRGEKDVKVIVCRELTGSLSLCASISHLISDSPSPFGQGLCASYPPSHPGGMFPSSFRSEKFSAVKSRAEGERKGGEILGRPFANFGGIISSSFFSTFRHQTFVSILYALHLSRKMKSEFKGFFG